MENKYNDFQKSVFDKLQLEIDKLENEQNNLQAKAMSTGLSEEELKRMSSIKKNLLPEAKSKLVLAKEKAEEANNYTEEDKQRINELVDSVEVTAEGLSVEGAKADTPLTPEQDFKHALNSYCEAIKSKYEELKAQEHSVKKLLPKINEIIAYSEALDNLPQETEILRQTKKSAEDSLLTLAYLEERMEMISNGFAQEILNNFDFICEFDYFMGAPLRLLKTTNRINSLR